jgi:hypothetical protein
MRFRRKAPASDSVPSATLAEFTVVRSTSGVDAIDQIEGRRVRISRQTVDSDGHVYLHFFVSGLHDLGEVMVAADQITLSAPPVIVAS